MTRYATILPLLLALLLLAPLSAAAQTFADPARLNLDAGDARQGGPMLRIGHDGRIYTAWVDFRENEGGDVYLRTSDDGGASFSPERLVYGGGMVPAGRGRGADLVVAPDGTIHMIWLAMTGPATTDVQYVRSTDGGISFSAPRAIVGDDGGAAQDFPSIAVDSGGALTIAWIDGRDKKRGDDDFDQIYVTRSTDGGVSFDAPRRASVLPGGRGGSCECCNTSTAVSRDGDIHIAFRANIDNVRDVHLIRSTDGGATFDTAIRMPSESWNIFACPMAGPVVGVDINGTAHVLWKDNRTSAKGKQYLYYAALWSGMETPTRDRPLTLDATRTNYPTIDFLPSGAMAIAFENYDGTANRAAYYASGDGGNSFEMLAETAPGTDPPNQEMPVVAVAPDGTRHMVWQDDRRGATDIWYARESSTIATVLPEPVDLIAPFDGELYLPGTTLRWSKPANLPEGNNIDYGIILTSVTDPGFPPVWIRSSDTSMRLTQSFDEGTYRWGVTAGTLIGSSEIAEYRTFVVRNIGGVDDESGSARIAVTPNPVRVDEDVEIVIDREGEGRDHLRVALYDLLGKEIALLFDGAAGSPALRLTLSCAELAGGAYTIVVVDGKGRTAHRLIVTK